MSQVNLRTTATIIGAVTSLQGNTGPVVNPVAGIINVVGGTNVNTSGAGNTLTINATPFVLPVTNVTNAMSPYAAIDASDYILTADSLTGVITITLPNAPAVGRTFIIKDSGGTASAANITVQSAGGADIDGITPYTINTDWESITVVYNGVEWFII